ncbi:hypothetical protein HYH03_010520 [Edaphochlamys debaryana]|uniref:Uncharacterized protein n=1 Tax=Edaphochlamys debaryana TaxID=47281 RepID=A0A835Y1Z0_9CHLO|nr:hypothetical protein HYH03_010520 [Edaphochlamys debaryana]|eukprot:KAG2491075.1 hypothetical protein HYH03_010520 [Edaphochlamys debaryana]
MAADWSEAEAWDGALQAACAGDPSALPPLRRALGGLHTLLPDLGPHWREQLGVHRSLVELEASVRGVPPPPLLPHVDPTEPGGWGPDGFPDPGLAAASPSAPSQVPSSAPTFAPTGSPAAAHATASVAALRRDTASPSPSPPSSGDVCLYSAAQRAAVDLQSLAPFFRAYGTRATESCFNHSMWVLAETLQGAVRNYCGPGSVLLRAADLAAAAGSLRALRRAHEAQLGALIRAQVRLALALPELSVRLVELQGAAVGTGLDVGRMVATNLGLMEQGGPGPGGMGGPAGWGPYRGP